MICSFNWQMSSFYDNLVNYIMICIIVNQGNTRAFPTMVEELTDFSLVVDSSDVDRGMKTGSNNLLFSIKNYIIVAFVSFEPWLWNIDSMFGWKKKKNLVWSPGHGQKYCT
jgi:hypothetical protein